MKTNRKLSILLILVLMLSLVVPAYADLDIDYEGPATITISGTSNHTQKPVTLTVYDRDKSVHEDQGLTDINGNYSFTITVDKGKQYTGRVKVQGEVKEFSFTTKGETENSFGEEITPSKGETLFFQDGIKIDLGDLDVDSTSRIIVNEKNIDNPDGLSTAGKIIEVEFKNINTDRLFEVGIPTNSGQKDKVSLYYYNPSTQKWEYQDSHKVNNLVVAQVNKEGTYGVFEDIQGPEKVKVDLKENTDERIALNLSAEDVSGIKMYEIYRDGNPIGYSNSGIYVDTKVSAGETYKYKIKAIDNLGNVSNFSSEITVKVAKDSTDTGKKVNVSIRIEGYNGTVLSNDNLEVGVFDLDPYLANPDYSKHPDAKESNGWPKERFSGPTVTHALVQALRNHGKQAGVDYDLEDYGWACYLSRIGEDKEFKYRNTSGWMYRVNGWMPNYGSQDYVLEDGDRIEWFFGVNGFMTWFTTISANKTNVAPGEEVILTLDGEMTDLTSEKGRGTTHTKKISNAEIYVNKAPYYMDGKSITTDDNGQAIIKFDKPGTYYISAERSDRNDYKDIVRPIPIKIIVTGEPASGGSSVGGGGGSAEGGGGVSNPEYQEGYEKVTDEKATEKDVVEAVESSVDKLSKDTKEIKGEKEAVKAANDVKDVLNIMDKSLDKIETKEGAKKAVESNKQVLDVLVKSSEKVTTKEGKKEISNVAANNVVNSTLKLIEKVEDEKEVENIANNTIDSLGKIIKNVGKDNAKEIEKKTIKVAQQTVTKLSTSKVSEKDIKVEGDSAIIKVNGKDIDKKVENLNKNIKNMEKKLAQNNIDAPKKIENKLSIELPKTEKSQIETILPTEIVNKAADKGVSKVEIKTEIGSFNVSKNTFDAKTNEIKLAVNKSGTDIEIKVLDEKGTQLEVKTQMEVSIPFEGKATNKDKVTAILVKEDGTRESIGGIYDETTGTIKFLTNKQGKFTVEEGTREFKDTSKHKWAEEAIESMAVKGIIDGKSQDKFAPKDNITRAEFAALALRMLKLNEKQEKQLPFKDVKKDKWYYNSVSAVYENGLMEGKSDKGFDPEGNITREEMAKIIGGILEKNSYKKQDKKELAKFKDKDSVAPWAQEAAAIAVHNGVIDGSNGKFKPKSNATRAEAAVMLYRLYELILN